MAKQNLDLVNYIPLELRNERNTSLFQNLFNRFLAEEKSVSINGQIGKITDSERSVIQAVNLDREQNSLIPAIYYKTGTEEKVFTFEDLINKMVALGINTNNLDSILSEQSLNFVPPVSIDKLINFNNYYWVGKSNLTPSLAWNEEVDPEYYVIEKPKATSTLKLPVRLATTGNVKLWGKNRARETVTVLFSSAATFLVTGNKGTLLTRTTSTIGAESSSTRTLSGPITTVYTLAPDASGINDPETSQNDNLFSFNINTGNVPFSSGDYFSIDIEYITGSNTITFHSSNPAGKGFISAIIPDTQMMYVDGLQVSEGDSILVWQQTNLAENGIYTVQKGQWERRNDANSEENLPIDSLVYVTEGTQAGKTFKLTRSSSFTLDEDDITFTLESSILTNRVNDWQIYNYWVHIDDLTSDQLGFAIQASRPIIEYWNGLQLNSYIDLDGSPSSAGTFIPQRKTRLNQIPQFDLFYYNGTHAKKTSGIFFYTEDPDYPIDVVLQRRLKTTLNHDYVFGIGIQDEDDRLLFWKHNDLKTIWSPGVTQPESSIPITEPPEESPYTIFDQFNDEAGTTILDHEPDVGGPWYPGGGVFTYAREDWVAGDSIKIVDNNAGLGDLGQHSTFNSTIIPGSNYFVELTFNVTPGDASGIVLYFQMDPANGLDYEYGYDGNAYAISYIYPDFNNDQSESLLSVGGYGNLIHFSEMWDDFASYIGDGNHVFRIEVVGTTGQMMLDGVIRRQFTMTTSVPNAHVGFGFDRDYFEDGPGPAILEFKAGPITALTVN